MNVVSPLEDLASAPATSEPIIEITDAALAKLKELRDEEADADQLGLRVEIASRPGEDFRYELGFEEFLTAAFTDEVRTHDGLKVMIPGKDIELLPGRDARLQRHAGSRDPQPEPPGRRRTSRASSGDDELSAEIEALVDAEVNPALAAHGGFVTYVGHDGEGTAYMTMGGGCHGCSMSKMTMLDGVQTMLSPRRSRRRRR